MSLPFKKKIIRDFSRAAKTYDNYAMLQRKVTERLFGIFIKSLSLGQGSILDIGCGTGYFHELLRKNKIYLPLVQTDISPAMCQIAESYASLPEYGKTSTVACDMHNLPFAVNIFEAIFSSMTMQWSEELLQTFTEAKNVLKENGNFAFSIVGNGTLHELKEAFLLAGLNPPIHSFASDDEIANTLSQAGLTATEIFSETITMFYDDIYSLLRSIKNVGASYKGNNYSGLRGKKYFTEVEKIYRNKFANEKGLPVSWNIIYVQGCK